MRIVSLLPSATEIVYALGLEDQLVGVTFECDEPARARHDHTVVVSGRDTSTMSVADIDAYVRDRMAAGEDLYTLDEGAMSRLDPDLILTQDLCRVCAVPTGQVDAALDHLGCRAEVVTLDPMRLSEVLDCVTLVGERAGVPDRARTVVSDLQGRLDAVAAAVDTAPRRRVAVVEWTDPLYTGGHWIPDQIEAAGAVSVAGHRGTASGPTPWDHLQSASPEVVFVAPCGYGLDAAAAQAGTVVDRLPGVEVWAVDGNAVVVRPGPRLVDGVEAMAAALHPDRCGDHPAARFVRRIA
ncbi:hypothetical protein HMPREF0063_10364 [Aeromicrobium marinum DSM 15272]|uniref:Fe/B12 periplasmic-binding domain-containing protein n=1 Tax=Aeromicrobium marinum DSM 15272 TaxID=585531 RepID=E2S8K7_9ACTN|nr:ABC transporter substrate-binding protein [Aeromicrobium marinum]EFQ84512.1 hypothetical protein HMPREF0063_10364 [Aeromicrobium marinum DSM 15272]